MILEELGRTNPWNLNWFCPKMECTPCRGRQYLTKEAEEDVLKMVNIMEREEGGGGNGKQEEGRKVRIGGKDRIVKAGYTEEGINYILECQT